MLPPKAVIELKGAGPMVVEVASERILEYEALAFKKLINSFQVIFLELSL